MPLLLYLLATPMRSAVLLTLASGRLDFMNRTHTATTAIVLVVLLGAAMKVFLRRRAP